MKRLISINDCKSYTHLRSLFKELQIPDDYKWLVTDIEAYSIDQEFDLFLANNSECFICTHKELMTWLEKDDVQWIWAVFSLFYSTISLDKILVEELPGIGDEHPRPHLFDDNKSTIQHPLAVLEIDAFDSTFMAMTSKEDKYIDIFKKLYPLSTTNFKN